MTEITDRVFSVQIWCKGTQKFVAHEFIITRDLQLKTSEKKLKEIFSKGVLDAANSILSKKDKVDELLME